MNADRCMIPVRLLLAGAWSLTTGFCLAASVPFEAFLPTHPQPTANHLVRVRYSQGTFCAVGEFGTLAVRDADGLWWPSATGLRAHLAEVAHVGSQWFAMSQDTGVFATGTSLESLTPGLPDPFQPHFKDSVAVNGTLWVTFRDQVSASSDGLSWDFHPLPAGVNADSIAHGQGVFVVADGNGRLVSSPDGSQWTLRFAPVGGQGAEFLRVVYAGNRFLAGGKNGLLLSSVNGLEWTPVTLPTTDWVWDAVQFRGAYYVTGGAGNVWRSTDLSGWTAVKTTAWDTLYGFATDGTRLIAVGRSGGITATTDGTQWVSETEASGDSWPSVAYGNGRFCAVESSTRTFSSADGTSWSPSPLPSNANPIGVGFAQGQFVVVSSGGTVLSSPDALQWTVVHELGVPARRLRRLNDRWVVVSGNGDVAVGTSPTQWTIRSAGTQLLWDATHGNGRYVVAAEGGQLWGSTDGLQWTPVHQSTASRFRALAYGSGRFVAFGGLARAATSTDGILWTETGFVDPPFNTVNARHIGGEFVAFPAFGAPRRSADGLTWQGTEVPLSLGLADIAVGNQRWVMTGPAGQAWATPLIPPVLSATRQNQNLVLTWPLETEGYFLESSPSVGVPWQAVNAVPVATPVAWSLSLAPGTSTLYRLHRR